MRGRSLNRFLAPIGPERIAAVRVLVGGYAVAMLLVRLPHLWTVAGFESDPRFDPVGALWFLDEPVAAALARGVLLGAIVAGVAFVTGWRWRWSGPAFALLLLAVTTYRNSFGQVWHVENLVVLHVLVLAAAPAADAWSLDRRDRAVAAPSADYGWPLRLCSLVTVLAYVIAGWAKLRVAGIDWVAGEALRNHVAHDNLRKALLGDAPAIFAEHALRLGWLFPVLAAVSVVIELGAPIALLRGRVRHLWIGGAWLFHLGVLLVMAITFPYQLSGVAYASMLPVERLAAARPSRRQAARVRGSP